MYLLKVNFIGYYDNKINCFFYIDVVIIISDIDFNIINIYYKIISSFKVL